MTTHRQHELVLVSQNFHWFTASLIVAVQLDLLVIGNDSENDLHQFWAKLRQIQSEADSTRSRMTAQTSTY